MNNIELLAPAGSMESLYAAVQAGANAVYLGGNKFSARAYASNFDEENMIKAVKYTHLYGKKIYVTLNTLLKDKEIYEALEYSRFLYNIGVDGLIIQDTGLINILAKEIPELELHGSTQMTVHNLEGAKFLKQLNFKRIVLSRELSLNEVQYISENLGIETEIFIHGALCVCYSGQCLMSSIIGGRSGNRGRCAQPCRLPYTLIDKNNGNKKKAYILSPKDICTLDNIKNIILSKAKSLKIEGRMKRPEYVAGVVDTYRRAIDFVQNGLCKNEFDFNKEKKKLLQLFNREGFSKAYLFGNTGKDMMAYSYPKNTGLYIGKVNKDLSVFLEENLRLKDGIRNKDKGFKISKITKKNKEVKEVYKGDSVKLFPTNYKAGDKLFKTSDEKLLQTYEKFFKDPFGKKINIKVSVKFKVGQPITIFSKIYDNIICEKGRVVEKALKKPLLKDKIEDNLKKTGNTIFNILDVNFLEFEEGFLPVSSINEVRRNFIIKLEENIICLNNNKSNNNIVNYKDNNNTYDNDYIMPKQLVIIKTREQLKAALKCNVKHIGFNPFLRNSDLSIEDFCDEKLDLYLKIPNILKEEFPKVCEYINKNFNNIAGIITANLGIINKFNTKLNIIADYKLNIFNKSSIDFYKKFIDGYCISVELNKKEMTTLLKKFHHNVQGLVYGKIELMVSEYCPVGSIFGGKSSSKKCNGYCNGKTFSLVDRKNQEFSVITDKFCRSYVYNGVPINLISNLKELENMNLKHFRLDFTDEDFDHTCKILESFKNKKWERDEREGFTRGHFKRGVE